MLKDISDIHKSGGDVSACIAKYRAKYKFAYIYNDNIFKLLFGNPENERMTADFLNAVLDLHGSDCIEQLTFVNPAVPGALNKSIVSDVVVNDQDQDVIVFEVQHVEDESYNGRLVYYTAKHTVACRIKGDNYNLPKFSLVSLQMFNGFLESKNYCHHICYKNQENEVFYSKQNITLVEIPKFLQGGYGSDNSMLAQWLRVIDGLNNECPVPVAEGSQFALLQEKAKLSIFTEEFLVSEAMNMSDRNYEMYVEKKHARAEGLAEGRAEGANQKAREMAAKMLAKNKPVDEIAEFTGLPETEILAIKASSAQ